MVKVLAGLLKEQLTRKLSTNCFRLKGNGGIKGVVNEIADCLSEYSFCCRTDVKSYYDSIDHYILLNKLHEATNDEVLKGYVFQFLNRTVESGGLYQEYRKGVPRASSLSPLLGAFYLAELDHRMDEFDGKYIRCMDDILILAKSRWKLKKAIKEMNRIFDSLSLEKHPDKTFIGRIAKGFDFLGYYFTPEKMSLAAKTIANFTQHIHRFYEQGAPEKRIGEYVT